MKQVSNAINSFVLDSRLHRSIPQRKTFSKCLFILLLAGVAIGGSSFQKENLMNSSQKQDHKNKCVPFKGKFTISFTETGVDGTGEASHIGRFTFVANDQLSTIIITAANGDQIFTTFTITVHNPLPNNMAQVHLDNIITGGTGRFAGATGSFGMDVLVNESFGIGAGTLGGTICH
ncbi:MAG: hypothetical protein M3Y85_05535 [Bacteroidota bacterium]|nr:hypothetical protein [Bacteroidota bacterium]